MLKRVIIGVGGVVVIVLLVIAVEILYIRYAGNNVPAPEIPREPQVYGSGTPLTYVVMGDSTSISQGGTYEKGFAVQSAQYLGKSRLVTFVNTGISGATAQTVKQDQLDKAVANKPDVVLLAVGANDVTHRTDFAAAQADLQEIVDQLRAANPAVKIVFTRSPAVDAVTRFPIGAKQLIRHRVESFNVSLEPFIARNNLVLAPVAEQTRQAFIEDPTLLAPDKFHPNDRGYALWVPVINSALDEALRSK